MLPSNPLENLSVIYLNKMLGVMWASKAVELFCLVYNYSRAYHDRASLVDVRALVDEFNFKCDYLYNFRKYKMSQLEVV